MIPVGLLPEGVTWVVAGGWAACPSLAHDQDIWVLVDEASELDDMRHKLLDNLRAYFGSDYEERVVELEDMRAQAGNYESIPIVVYKVARCYADGEDRHILVTSAGCALELIDGFDISTHMVAIEPDGHVVKGSQWTAVTEPPVMVRDTPTTRDRMMKIAARYGHPIPEVCTSGEATAVSE